VQRIAVAQSKEQSENERKAELAALVLLATTADDLATK